MHRVDEGADVLRVDLRVNAVTEVEDVAVALAEAGEHGLHFLADALRVGVEDARVHVALQGNLVAGELACVGEVDGPVHAECVTAGGSHYVGIQ